MTRCLASVLIPLALSSFLLAQADSRGDCELVVRVRTANDHGIEAPIQVQVLSPQGAIASAHVSGGEPARFQVANGKTYRLTVSGTGIEPVTTAYFEINPLEPEHTETVQVKFTNEKSADPTSSESPTVSVSDLKVPKKASGELKKGMDAYSRGELKTATAHFEKAIAEYPQYARAYDMLGVIAIKGTDRGNAREQFSKSIQVDSTFVPAYVDLARMELQDQNYTASESLLSKAIAANPSSPEAVALLATTEFANKEYDKALADVQRTHALRNHEQFAEVHIMAGKVLSLQNHPEAAVTQFELFLKEKPDSPEGQNVRRMLSSLNARQRP